MELDNIIIRRPNEEDNIEKIAELLYKTDPYIYPYWFETLDKCKKELTPLLLEEEFFFSIYHLFIAINKEDNEIVGVICILDKSAKLDYNYSKLKEKNERYDFTITNYVEELIKEVNDADFAYISNVCVYEKCRGMHIGRKLVDYAINVYKKKLFDHIVLDVLADNPGAIKLYQNMGFEQFTEIFAGFNDPKKERPDVFSMKAKIEKEL